MIKTSKNKILSHVVRFKCLVGIQILKYEFGPFLQLLKIKFDMPIDFAYGVGKIRSIYQNERLEKRSSISPGFTRWSFLRIGKFQKSKKLFQNEESRKIQKIKKIQKNLKTPKKTQKCITKKIVDFSWLFDFFGFFELFGLFSIFWSFFEFLGFFWKFSDCFGFFEFFGIFEFF